MTDHDDTESDRPYLGGSDVAPVFGRLFDQYALVRLPGIQSLVTLRVLRAIGGGRGRFSSRSPWVAVEWRSDSVAGLVGRAASPREEGHDEGSRVVDRVDAEVAVRRLAVAVADLSPGDRDVLLLTSWAGLDSNEVAEALGIPVGTVRSRLHRVRKSLRANGHRQHTAREEESHG